MKPVRVQLSRAKGWRMPPNTVKVARGTQWGNPIRVGALINVDADQGMRATTVTPTIAVELYRQWLSGQMRVPRFLLPLRGKNLACWCSVEQPCHADVLLELANK